jgi:two-component system, LuxR family, sensor kinase FixL
MFSRETQALMEAAVDAIVVIDHRGVMQAVNDATCRTFGYQAAELLGQNVSVLMAEPDHMRHDDYLERHLVTGHARIIGVGRDVRARRRDGSHFPVRLSVGRVPDAIPPRFVGLMRDVSAEQEASAALELQRDRANAYLELHDSILLELDAGHRICDINSRGAQLLGASAACIVGRSWFDFMAGEPERDRARFLLADAQASGAPRDREFDCRDVAGEPRRIHWRCIALRSATGAPAGWLCSGADVTARALAEHQARLAQDRLTQVARLATAGEMAAGVAHEINQPLTAITTYAVACERYLAMPQPDLVEARDAVREIAAEGLRAGEIIRRLRQMVRLDAPDTRSRQDVNALVEELRSLLDADARVHDVRLSIELEPDLPAVTGNGAHLQQVVLNLVRNALEALLELPATERRVRIETCTTLDGAVEIQVEDNGPGIDPAIADRLFDPFSTTKPNGTGLGLSMCRTIVQSHGGNIRASALSPHGTRFVVQLPVAEEVAA